MDSLGSSLNFDWTHTDRFSWPSLSQAKNTKSTARFKVNSFRRLLHSAEGLEEREEPQPLQKVSKIS